MNASLFVSSLRSSSQCEEEAGIPEHLASRAQSVGHVSYNGVDSWAWEGRGNHNPGGGEGYKRDVLFCYDLEVRSERDDDRGVSMVTLRTKYRHWKLKSRSSDIDERTELCESIGGKQRESVLATFAPCSDAFASSLCTKPKVSNSSTLVAAPAGFHSDSCR